MRFADQGDDDRLRMALSDVSNLVGGVAIAAVILRKSSRGMQSNPYNPAACSRAVDISS